MPTVVSNRPGSSPSSSGGAGGSKTLYMVLAVVAVLIAAAVIWKTMSGSPVNTRENQAAINAQINASQSSGPAFSNRPIDSQHPQTGLPMPPGKGRH